MTFEFIDTAQNDTLMMICTEHAQPAPSVNLRIQPWVKIALASVCLSQGLRLAGAHDPIGTLTGLALLACLPSCCYVGWRDYLRLKQARAGRAADRAKEPRKIVS